jgi:hypothetical protein
MSFFSIRAFLAGGGNGECFSRRVTPSLCRQQAPYNPAQSWHLLGQAERREHLAQDELDAHFKACNTARFK